MVANHDAVDGATAGSRRAGVSLMPQGVEHIGMKDIVVRTSVEHIPSHQAVAVSSKERPVTSAATKFIDWLRGYATAH